MDDEMKGGWGPEDALPNINRDDLKCIYCKMPKSIHVQTEQKGIEVTCYIKAKIKNLHEWRHATGSAA